MQFQANSEINPYLVPVHMSVVSCGRCERSSTLITDATNSLLVNPFLVQVEKIIGYKEAAALITRNGLFAVGTNFV